MVKKPSTRVRKVFKIKLSPEDLKKRRLENLKKANEARQEKKKIAAAAATKNIADIKEEEVKE